VKPPIRETLQITPAIRRSRQLASLGSDHLGATSACRTLLLPERQVSDLAFPFARVAAFRQKEYVIYGCAHPNVTAYFEHAGHWLSSYDAVVGVGRDSRHVVR
jgi:hypothetical protein